MQGAHMEPGSLPGNLHLSTIDSFDPACDIALGPHCFIGRETECADFHDLPYPEAFPDESSMTEAEEVTRKLVNHLLPRLTDQLNDHHGTSYSVDFWRIIILPWLIELVQKSWTSFNRIQLLREAHGSRPLTVRILDGENIWEIDETKDFLSLLLKDFTFNWWIDSVVLKSLAPDNWTLKPESYVSEAVPQASFQAQPGRMPGIVRKALQNMKYRLGFTDIVGLRYSGLLLALFANLLPKRRSGLHFTPSGNFDPKEHFPEAYLRTLDSFLESTMPRSFLDGFRPLLEQARRLPYKPGRLRLGTLSFWNEQEKVIAALAKEHGEKRVVTQHGGEYGMIPYNMMYNEMEGTNCIFISWGWFFGHPANGHVLPLPSPYHSKIANRHKRQNDSLIVIGQSVRINLNRFHWSCRSGLPLWYCKDVVRFLGNLDDDVKRDTVFRPHTRVANDIEIRDVVSGRFPEMPMLEGDLNEALLKCRLVVMNTFSTTINFTMAANVPTVAYMPPHIMKPHSKAARHFEPLRKCGILHETEEQAATHINRIWPDVEQWWASPDVQEARLNWTRNYARTDPFWLWTWMKALPKLRNVG